MSQSLERGLKALIFLSTRKSIGVTELADELKVDKSTAYRILETLQKYNMAVQNKSTAKYRLGPALLKFSDNIYRNMNVLSLARPLMQALAEEVGESVHLCVLANEAAVIVEQIMTNSRISVNAKVGNNEPLYSSSVGKCLLAYSNETIREQLINRIEFRRFTDKTIGSVEELRAELQKIKECGYAMDDGELSDEVICMAAPIFSHQGSVDYSMGISGPAYRMGEQKITLARNKLVKAAEELSRQLSGEGA